MKANFANALCHLNATPLSVAVLAPCAWGKNLACGGAWQSVFLGRNGAQQGALNSTTHSTAWRGEFDNETAQHSKIQWHSKANTANSVWRAFASRTTHGKFGLASVAKWAVLVGKAGTAKMGRCLGGGDFSLSLLALFGTPLR